MAKKFHRCAPRKIHHSSPVFLRTHSRANLFILLTLSHAFFLFAQRRQNPLGPFLRHRAGCRFFFFFLLLLLRLLLWILLLLLILLLFLLLLFLLFLLRTQLLQRVRKIVLCIAVRRPRAQSLSVRVGGLLPFLLSTVCVADIVERRAACGTIALSAAAALSELRAASNFFCWYCAAP